MNKPHANELVSRFPQKMLLSLGQHGGLELAIGNQFLARSEMR